MSVIVEDGTGLANANSYASESDADAYLAARGFTIWSPLQASEKTAALIRATDYMVLGNFQWKGVRTTLVQALDWPRLYVTANGMTVESNSIPTALKNACIELALRAAAGPLTIDPQVDSTGRLPTKLVKKVGPIDKETSYATRGQMATSTTIKRFPAVDTMLAQLVRDSQGGVYR